MPLPTRDHQHQGPWDPERYLEAAGDSERLPCLWRAARRLPGAR